jgi:hypothetical protein
VIRFRYILPAAAICAATAATTAAPADAAPKDKDLWATVNICDTKRSPDRLGLRARMPGNGTHQRMYMRFVVQYRDGKTWKSLGGNGRSPWLYAGSALFKNREYGYTIPFRPDTGDRYLVRGLVRFEWRARHNRRGRVVTVVKRREARLTSAGHRTRGAQPGGYSAATCVIEGPARD